MIQVLSFHIKQAMRSGRPGRDLLPAGGAVYDATAVSPEFKSNSTRPHREVSFLRDASVAETLLFMKNKGVHPVKVRAGDMPNGRPWDNFDVCAHTFHVKYCSLEGLSRTSDMSRVVIQYIFHGFFEWRTKTRHKVEQRKMKSFFFFLHKKLVGGRSRFTNKVESNFSKFISLYRRNEPTWKLFLNDCGKREVPIEYNIAFEEGLRNFSSCIHSMGTRPLRSPEFWGKSVDLWRKKEAYIALGRFLLDAPVGYRQWDCFKFEDYVSRSQLSRTFVTRHLPLSNGDDEKNFNGKFKFDWSKYSWKRKKKLKRDPEKRCKLSHDTTSPTVPMIFDVEQGCLVPLE